MTNSIKTALRPSRRRIIKGALCWPQASPRPPFLRVRSAYAAYPERPVKIVVANTPGGPPTSSARITAAALEQSTGKTFIIENSGGAGGNIGMGYAAHVRRRTATRILLATNAYSVNATLYNKMPYDPRKDFVGVSELATSPNTFVVKSELPAKTMKEFVALASANPDKFNCATPPIGTTPQIQLEVLKIREKLPKLTDVVFKGGGDAITALLGSTVQLSSGSLPPAAPHIKAGTMRCLAVTGETRWPDMPDVPTMAGGRLQGLRVRHRHRAAGAGQDAAGGRQVAGGGDAESPRHATAMKEKLYKAGFQVRPKGGDDAWARVTKEIGMFKDIIDQAGIQRCKGGSSAGEDQVDRADRGQPADAQARRSWRAKKCAAPTTCWCAIETDNGLVGWGEAASAPIMTGETLESIVAAVHYLAPALRGREPPTSTARSPPWTAACTATTAPRRRSKSRCTILPASAAGKPVHALLGEKKREPHGAARRHRRRRSRRRPARCREAKKAAGFTAYKIKVGVDTPQSDAARTRAICKLLGPRPADFSRRQPGLHHRRGHALCARGRGLRARLFRAAGDGDDLAGMAEVAAATAIAIGADEGIHSLDDISRHHELQGGARRQPQGDQARRHRAAWSKRHGCATASA